jgi:hypothetical protein
MRNKKSVLVGTLFYSALFTFPERKQRVHTLIRFGTPSTRALTLWILGDQVLLVWMLEWLTCIPVLGTFPQISHLAMVPPPVHSLLNY